MRRHGGGSANHGRAVTQIRAATAADVAAVQGIVERAYGGYVARIGKPPGPMLDNYAARITEGVVQVLEVDQRIVGVLVLIPAADHLLLDNVVVDPSAQGLGSWPSTDRGSGGRGPAR